MGSVQSEQEGLTESWFGLGRGNVAVSPGLDRILIFQVHLAKVASLVVIQFIDLLFSVFFLLPPLCYPG